MKKIIATFALATVIVSCGSQPTANSKTSQESLLGTLWSLSENVKGKNPTLKIEEGRVSGNAGCNSYFGTFAGDMVTGNFSVKEVGSTKMMCENMSTETNFLNALNEANSYTVKGNTLELYKGKLLLLKFNRQ